MTVCGWQGTQIGTLLMRTGSWHILDRFIEDTREGDIMSLFATGLKSNQTSHLNHLD